MSKQYDDPEAYRKKCAENRLRELNARHTHTQSYTVNKPEDYGCPECIQKGLSPSVRVTGRNVICNQCGLKFSFEEYYDFIETQRGSKSK